MVVLIIFSNKFQKMLHVPKTKHFYKCVTTSLNVNKHCLYYYQSLIKDNSN